MPALWRRPTCRPRIIVRCAVRDRAYVAEFLRVGPTLGIRCPTEVLSVICGSPVRLRGMLQDLRYGIRTLLRAPWSAAITVLSLALGIGVNVTVFTAYKAFFLRPLDARDPGEMANIALTRESGTVDANFSYPDYEAYRDSVRAFAGIAAYRPQQLQLSSAGVQAEASGFGRMGLLPPRPRNTEFAMVYIASENFFRVFGVSTMRGGAFDSISTEPSVLISENYWQRRFSGDPAIIGRTIRLNQVAVTIAGIAPRDFAGANIGAPAFWMPVTLDPVISAAPEWLRDRENRRYRLFGRLVRGVEMAQASAEFTLVANRLQALHDPKSDSAKSSAALVWPGSPFPFPIHTQRGLSITIILIMFAALMVLAVASANAGGLQLARTRVRETELRIRISLGATRLRVIRQLLTESALTSVLAGVLALLFSWALLKGAVKMVAEALPVEFGGLVFDVSPNPAVFTFVLIVSVIGGILSGLAPAIQSPRAALTSSDRAATGSVRARRLQNALVAVQVALSTVLVITGAMFARGAAHALQADPGFDSKHVTQLDLQFPKSYPAARKAAALNEIRSRVAATPGVTSTAIALPPGSSGFQSPVIRVDTTGRSAISMLRYTYVEPGYFETLGVPVVAGTSFGRDSEGGQFAVLSESAANQIFGRENPLGQRIRLGVTDERPHSWSEPVPDGPELQVIGVVGDTRGFEYDGSGSKQVYLQLPAGRAAGRPLLIRTRPLASALIGHVETAVSVTDPDIGATVSTLDSALRRSGPFIGSTLAAAAASTLGAFGSLLALMGIFATVSFIVALRTREVGIRIALGAQSRGILRLILGEISHPVMAGLAAGLILASGVFYLLRGVLYGVNALDGVYFAGVALVFLAVALLASLPPALRATRVDPMVALRFE